MDMTDPEFRKEFMADQVRVRIALSIRRMREEAGLSQADLAKRLGWHQSVVSRLENPDYGRVSLTTLLTVAAFFDAPLLIEFVSWRKFMTAPMPSTTSHQPHPQGNSPASASPRSY